MKRILFSSFFIGLNFLVFAQFSWTKYEFNQVLQPGPDNFDIIAIGQPTVLFEEGTIKMWYAGVGNDMKARLCYATSTDGINWTKHGVVMEVGGDGEWDRGWIDTPEVLKVPDGYYLSYYGDTIQQVAETNSAMGSAYSADGITWTKDPENPIFTKSEIGEWDGTWVESAALYWDDVEEQIVMWYNGMDTATWQLGIGVATSPDGTTWTRYVGNPVIIHGIWGEPDDMWCGTPAVLYRNDKFEMWYSGTAAEDYSVELEGFENVSICYATSEDGYNWAKYEGNPLFDTYTEPHNPDADLGGPWAPDVIYNESTETFMMWYEAHGGTSNYGFSLATAPLDVSEINRVKPGKNLVLYPNPVIDYLNIQQDNFISAEIYNLQGKLLIESNSSKIDVSELASGVYLLTISTKNGVITKKIVKN
ncbi:MAG: hypothetical protein C0596_11010 [Marinilabiliales bacterium]|nr:MAG: hypothetical protein C0596_11010 [Marinilabiliales bacterium]